MPLAWPAGVDLGIQRHDVHLPYQTLNSLEVYRIPQILKIIPDPATAIERAFEMDLINQPHQLQIFIGDAHRLIIHGGAIEVQQLTLAGHRQ